MFENYLKDKTKQNKKNMLCHCVTIKACKQYIQTKRMSSFGQFVLGMLVPPSFNQSLRILGLVLIEVGISVNIDVGCMQFYFTIRFSVSLPRKFCDIWWQRWDLQYEVMQGCQLLRIAWHEELKHEEKNIIF